MNRVGILACVAVTSMFLITQFTTPPSNGQEKESVKNEGAKKSVTKTGTFRRRLPNYYGQVGINSKQKADIYKIQETYHNQIEALRKQIAALEQKRDSEVKGVLSEDQQKKVDELLAAAKARTESRRNKKRKKTE